MVNLNRQGRFSGTGCLKTGLRVTQVHVGKHEAKLGERLLPAVLAACLQMVRVGGDILEVMP